MCLQRHFTEFSGKDRARPVLLDSRLDLRGATVIYGRAVQGTSRGVTLRMDSRREIFEASRGAPKRKSGLLR